MPNIYNVINWGLLGDNKEAPPAIEYPKAYIVEGEGYIQDDVDWNEKYPINVTKYYLNPENALKEFLYLFLTYGGYAGRGGLGRPWGLASTMDSADARAELSGEESLKNQYADHLSFEAYGLSNVAGEAPELFGWQEFDGQRQHELEEMGREELVDLWVKIYVKKLMDDNAISQEFEGYQEWTQGEWHFYVGYYDIKAKVKNYIKKLQKFEDA